VQTQYSTHNVLQEQAGYFEAPGAHLFTMLHRVEDPVGRVLLAGSFASERHFSYDPWVAWARFLARKGVEVLRYDYRGVGESEGAFEEVTFERWAEDVELLAGWLKSRSPDVPLVLHGLELGAVLTGKAFHAGIGDALLLWAPTASANLALRPILLRWVAADQLFKYGDDRRPASAYIREMEEGSTINVEGYRWTPKLWQDSTGFLMPDALQDESRAHEIYRRPVSIVKLGKDAVPLVKGGYVVANEPKDFTPLFEQNWGWLAGVLAIDPGGSRETGN
jgi:serine aminopeptidase S33 family